jgi:hypothetical protein
MESIARTREYEAGGARDRIVTVLCNGSSLAYLDNNSECADVVAQRIEEEVDGRGGML